MKNLVFGVIAVVLFAFNGNAQEPNKNLENLYASNDVFNVDSNVENNLNEKIAVRKWWVTAIVDGAGALGGAGSVASFISVGSATPWGWAAIAGGAILGGAGASLAKVGNVKPQDNGIKDLSNSLNEFDWVGVSHNQIINDYFSSNYEFNSDNYLDFIKTHKCDYKNIDVYFENEYIKNQTALVVKLETDEQVIDYALENLPDEIDKEEFKQFLNNLLLSQDGNSFIKEVKTYENKFINEKHSKETKIKLLSFFSTLRYSCNLW